MSFPLRLFLCSTLPVAVLAIPLNVALSQAVTVTTLARLGGDPDGYHPQAALISGGDGFFYGTTEAGGTPNCGTVYKVAPDGRLTTLYSFTGGSDGANPMGGLTYATDGNFYGTTSGAGSGGTGTIFKITAAGALSTVYSFTALGGTDNEFNADGAYPEAALVQGSDGNFYGTAYLGGSAAGGTVFRVTPAGALTSLANFDTLTSALVEGSDGNFYGVAPTSGPAYAGGIYKITPAGVLTTVYTFTGGSDGSFPEAALVKGNDDNLYGTTAGGGNGTVFQLTLAGVLTTLHTFDPTTEGQPQTAPLILGTDGNFYGTTGKDGPTGSGMLTKSLQPGR